MDNNTNTQDVNTVNTSKNEVQTGSEPKFTQSDMDKLAGKIRSEEKSKSEEAIKIAIAEAIAEERRQAKLTEEEKQKEAKAKYEKELKERENEITIRERRLEAQEKLMEKNISADFVDFVVDLDIKKMNEKIEQLAKTYNKSVEKAVTDKLKGTPPSDFSKNNDTNNNSPKYSGTVIF